ELSDQDFEAFERLLGDIQTAYSKRDIATIERSTTPEMQSYFTRDLADDDAAGVRNEISDVKLLQGDLSEAWREAGGEYATVAMRYSLRDVTVETATGRIVSGSRDHDEEVVELWTFRRPVGGNTAQWELSAIQSA
ncbi:MAG TPA: TIM44-like domain-containing protein, partial [Hyphomicrobiaceae bacterium]|nr:TIM44-like domain-containing protein [Hyphomicrobiaceae bacterium]